MRSEDYRHNREHLLNQLLSMKKQGYQAWISKETQNGRPADTNYALLSDGKDILYLQMAEYRSEVIVPYYQWQRSRKNGTGTALLKEGTGHPVLTTETFLEDCATGRQTAMGCGAVCYKNLEEYKKQNRQTMEALYMPV